MKKTSFTRIGWIDNLRGFAILLVVIGHSGSLLNNYIFSFHMPLFFFLSGIMFKKTNEFTSFFKKKNRTLVIPYLFFSSIFYLFWLFFERNKTFVDSGLFLSEGLTYSPLTSFIGIFYSAGGKQFMYWGVHLWFLTCLFIALIIFYFMVKLSKLKLSIVIIVSFILGILLTKYSPITLPWSIDVAFVAVTFIGFGYLIKEWLLKIEFKTNKTLLLVSIFFTIGVIVSLLNGKIDMRINHYNNPILFLIGSISGILLYTILFKNFSEKYCLKWLGINSLLIYALHLKLEPFAWAVPFLPKLLHDYTGIIGALWISGWEILISIPIILFFNRYLYFIFGKKVVEK